MEDRVERGGWREERRDFIAGSCESANAVVVLSGVAALEFVRSPF